MQNVLHVVRNLSWMIQFILHHLNKAQKDTIKNVGTLNIIRCNVVDWFVKVHIKKII